jgi:Domain of unknown function (DUF222)
MGTLAETQAAVIVLERAVGDLDPARLAATDAAALFEVFARAERLGAAGKSLTARRVADSAVWRAAGERSPAHWMATRTGTSIGAAVAALETAQRMEELPALEEAYKAGRLSDVMARDIASTAAATPASEAELLAVADNQDVTGLRDACRRVAAAAATDEVARHQAIHRGRYARNWHDPDGAARLDVRLTPEAMADVVAGIEAFEPDIFQAARASGRKEPYHAYLADALVAMARAARHADTGRAGGPLATVHVLIDHAALVRGYTVAGETCEIAGIGPVPVATARAIMADAFVTAVVTDGVEVSKVVHLGRTVTAHQRTALEVRDRECVVPGCHVRRHLEIDHVEPWAPTRVTRLDRLARLCHFHHAQKTYQGYRLEGTPGQWRWLKPDDSPVSADRSTVPPQRNAVPNDATGHMAATSGGQQHREHNTC